jgi:2-C-methyl-D-erythritol 4-phosphate cytidylyltransferase
MDKFSFSAVIPAAGIGKRVGANIPKQYLKVLGKTILEHSVMPFLEHPDIHRVVISLAKNDQWFKQLDIAHHPKVTMVEGGEERVDSVLNALKLLDLNEFILVHDAARPCLQLGDIDKLLQHVTKTKSGAILACKVRDTMKRSDQYNQIKQTVERQYLWHALTPQLFNNRQLINAITAIEEKYLITDEASAIELAGGTVSIVEGRSDNLKVTQAEDLLLTEFYLSKAKPYFKEKK